MKTTIQFCFSVSLFMFMLMAFTTSCKQQDTSGTQPRYKDMVGDNPNAEADMKVVSDYTNALVSGDTNKVKSLLADNYIGRGPARMDSSTVAQRIKSWQGNYKTQTDRKTTFVTQTFQVLTGRLKGNWVSLWGDYTFTSLDKTVTLPYQYTARVADGKIQSDRIYYDALSIFTQLGYKLTPPEAAKK